MAEWCTAEGISILLTAHHADDQAETLIMRLQRGSGVAGLAGIRAARRVAPSVTLVRPLLGVRRAELAALVATAGWLPVQDPANADLRYDRTAARALLAQAATIDVARLAASAAHLADAEVALDWSASRAWAGAAVAAGDCITLDVAGLPDELVRRLLRRAVVTLNPAAAPHGPQLAALQAELAAGGIATLAGVKAGGGAVWHFSRAAPRRKKG